MLTQVEYLETLSDAKLVKEFLHGSNVAFYVLEKRHNPHLKVYLHALLHNAARESEALQLLWIKVRELLRRHKYHECGRFKEWLNTRVFWEAKHVYDKPHGIQYEHQEELPDMPEEPVDDGEEKERYLLFFRHCLAEMGEPIITIVRMHNEQNLTFVEIGAALNMKQDKARLIYWRTMRKLEKLFNKKFGRRGKPRRHEEHLETHSCFVHLCVLRVLVVKK